MSTPLRLFESVYIAFVMIIVAYYFISWLEGKIRRAVDRELYFEVSHQVDCQILNLIDTGVLETTEEYKKNPDKFSGPKPRGKVKVVNKA